MTQRELEHPDRHINLASGENVRDMGGYQTLDGHTTTWRVFVRSGDMDNLSGADQQALVDYGISTVIDLRMRKERDTSPNVFAKSDTIDFRIHDFWGRRFDDYRSANKTAPAHLKLGDLYCAGLKKSGFVMADIMETFAEANRSGYTFHCRSGKDRTGLVAMMLLSIAEVPEDVICADYALTADYLRHEAINPIEANKPGIWQRTCEPETMAHTLGFLRREYGGPVAYLSKVGVRDESLDSIKAKIVT